MKRVVLAVGGTGGHVLPAMQIGHQMEAEGYQVTYMGFGLSGNRFFDKELHHYDVGTSWKAGIQISVRLLKRLQPTMVFGFGSFHSVPILAAALWLRVPYYLFEFNVMPGRVNRLFAYGAKKVFVHFDVKRPLRGVIEKIDYPFAFPDVIPQKEAVHHFGLESHRKTLLVFGGSQGAEAINQLVLRSSPYLRDAFQVLHFPGKESLVKETYDTYGIPSYVEPFCHRMHLAIKSALWA